MTQRRTATLVAATAALVLAIGGAILAARAGDRSAAAPRTSASSAPPARVVLPGRPGESATVTDSDRVRAPDGSTYNAVDTAFVRMMIAHHAQAITMARLAPDRAADASLRALAERIGAAQAPEIDRLRAWLSERRLDEVDPTHDHATMPGMQTDADMAALAAARGTDFDRRFVTMMTAHHRGAIQMAGDVLNGGTDQTVSELANEMAAEQGSEIRRMDQLKAA
jgi:uncharacterized protein (DUF305 family)